MKPDIASFHLRDADTSPFDIGKVAISCYVDFDREKKCWKAYDESGNEAWSDWKPLAAARLFAARMEREAA